MKFTEITYSGTSKVAHGYDNAGKPITREFPYSISDSEIFALGDKKPPVEPPTEQEADGTPVNDDPPNVDDTTANEKPNVKTKK